MSNSTPEYTYTNSSPDHVAHYLLEPIMTYLVDKKAATILDIGCGNGWLVNALIQEGYHAFGIDASVSGIQIANEVNPGHFYIQDLTKDDLPSELSGIKFNIIISTEVIEHLYSPQKYVEFCKKIIRENGGELIISTPYHGYLKNLALALSGKLDNHFSALWEGGHIKFWSKNTLTQLLETNGFQVTKFIGCGRIPPFWKSMILISTYKQ